jgi:predicted regulator of Ras-like GTPase activity (Roadblock/LC7/MglB family)
MVSMTSTASLPRRSPRSDQIDSVLAALSGLRGVVAAAIVDGDGFVTHIRRDFELNTDALGAAVQVTLGAAARAAAHVGQTNTEMAIMENKDGTVMLAPLVKGFSLAIVADKSVMLGAARFEVKQSLGSLIQMLS